MGVVNSQFVLEYSVHLMPRFKTIVVGNIRFTMCVYSTENTAITVNVFMRKQSIYGAQ